MTAKEFLTEKEITAEKLNNEVLYELIVGLMEAYALVKQIEAVNSFGEELKKELNKKSTIIMP